MISISVVIPCYNCSKTIVKCIESVLQQTYKVDEIILIDDGSTDNTIEVIEELIENSSFKNFQLFQQENAGPSKARNVGILNSKSDWIAFLDSDDIWIPEKLENQVEIIKEFKDVSLISGGHEKNFFPESVKYKEITLKHACFKNFFETPTVLVKKEVCKNILFDERMKYAEDYNLWLNILVNNKAIYSNKILSTSILNKRTFGEAGLSKHIFAMEKGELKSIYNQFKKGNISFLLYASASSISLLKFTRRYILTKIN